MTASPKLVNNGIKKAKSRKSKSESAQAAAERYFAGPWGSTLIDIGLNVVREYLQDEPVDEIRQYMQDTRLPTIKCKMCNFVAESSFVMSDHYRTPHLKRSKYRCNFCSEKSVNSQEIEDHMRSIHGIDVLVEKQPKKYQCSNCTFESKQERKLNRHLVECRTKFRLDKNLEIPLSTPLPAYRYSRPKKEVKEKKSPIANPSNANMQPSFVECEICDKNISNMESLYDHMKNKHNEIVSKEKMVKQKPGTSCTQCQLCFYSKGGLERHYLGLHGLVTTRLEKAYKKKEDCGRCPICRKSFDNSGLVDHVSEEHNSNLQVLNISYRCEKCNETFTLMKNFNSHTCLNHGSS